MNLLHLSRLLNAFTDADAVSFLQALQTVVGDVWSSTQSTAHPCSAHLHSPVRQAWVAGGPASQHRTAMVRRVACSQIVGSLMVTGTDSSQRPKFRSLDQTLY